MSLQSWVSTGSLDLAGVFFIRPILGGIGRQPTYFCIPVGWLWLVFVNPVNLVNPVLSLAAAESNGIRSSFKQPNGDLNSRGLLGKGRLMASSSRASLCFFMGK